VAVELKPMPSLSSKSSSPIARLRVNSGELSPGVASRTADNDLNSSIEGSIAQVSVMWLLHRGLDVVQDHGESLEQKIVEFSSAVFDAIETSYPTLRNAGREHLWFIYFKGLLNANTHPHAQMVPALRNIASRSGFGGLPRPSKKPGERAKPTPGHASEDVEILKQIARGLADK
jgi:hypothetical protein